MASLITWNSKSETQPILPRPTHLNLEPKAQNMNTQFDQTILLTFLQDAESNLPTIRQGISDYAESESNFEAFELSYRQIHKMKGAALMIDLPEVGQLAEKLESAMDEIVESKRSISGEEAASFLKDIDLLEMFVSASKEMASEQSFEIDQTEESYGFDDSESSASFEYIESTEEFEIDDEMLEIFGMEAEEHLQTIAAQLDILEGEPNDRNALQEIRRSAHTLKGASGVVGLKTFSTLAHKVEDLLDFISEKSLEGTTEIVSFLFSATEVMSNLSANSDSGKYQHEVNQLITRHDEILASIERKLNQKAESEETGELETEELAVSSITDSRQDVVEPLPETFGKIVPRSVVRISLDRLDELVKAIGELTISRTIVEQKLSNLEKQIDELHHSTTRLRRVSGKLEIDFEAKAFKNRNNFARNLQSFPIANNQHIFIDSFKTTDDFDDLEFDRYTEFHQLTREVVETSSDTAEIGSDLDGILSELENLLSKQRRLSESIQDKLMHLRTLPFGSIAPRLQRTVRVAADQESKLAELIIEGETLEVDTQILDSLSEPLLHILRNAIAHGIEPPRTRQMLGKNEYGVIRLSAKQEGTNVVIKISDDGRGISVKDIKNKALKAGFIDRKKANSMSKEEALELIFLQGLSTADKVTEISGRGVGMDIVRESIARQRGTISLKSVPQKGTTFIIRLPMALVATRALMVKAGGQTFAFPLSAVRQVTEVYSDMFVKPIDERGVIFEESFFPVVHLNDVLKVPFLLPNERTKLSVLLLNLGENSPALVVEKVLEARELVIKPLGKPLENLHGHLGAAILGNGKVVPVLNLLELLENRPKIQIEEPEAEEILRKESLSVLVVDDSPSVRRVMSNLIESVGWKTMIAKDGIEALELLQSSPDAPDIILTDVEMPRMDGYELLATLNKEESSPIPVVMITSRAGEKHRQKAFDLGVSAYITKPYEENELLETIKSLTNISEINDLVN